MQALPALPMPSPAVLAGVACCALAAGTLAVPGMGWPAAAAAAGLLVWLACVALRPGTGTLAVQAAGLGIGSTALAMGAGGVASPAMLAVLWPLAGLAAGGAGISRGVPVTLAAAVAAAGLGPVLARGGPLVEPLWGGGLAVAVTALLAVAALVTREHAAAAGTGDGASAGPTPAAGPAVVPATDPVRALALEALDEAERAQADAAARARFIAEMSHEIRTPLNAIIGFSDTMREGVFGPLPDRYRDYAGLIHQSGTHLNELVSDLLDLSKVEAGRYRLVPEPLDLQEIVAGAVAIGAGSAGAQDVRVRMEPGPPVQAVADPRALRQMVLNLVSNAVKFTPAGGGVTVRALDAGTGPRIEVQDTGVGMSAEQLARVGQPWAGGEGEAKGLRGTGLGLTLVQRLAELQGGRLSLASQPGVGTLAVITLRAAPDP